MTKKQIKKIASEMTALEKIHNDGNSSQDQIAKAEKRIMQLTEMIMRLPHDQGFEIMAEIDEIIQKNLKN